MKLSVTASAHREIDKAAAFYARQQRSLGAAFIVEVDRMLAVLRHNPWLGQRLDETYRRVHLQKFPYTLIYKSNDRNDSICVSAVCHQHRRPDYWRNRVEESIAIYEMARVLSPAPPNHLQKIIPIPRQLRLADAANLQQRLRIRRPVAHHLA